MKPTTPPLVADDDVAEDIDGSGYSGTVPNKVAPDLQFEIRGFMRFSDEKLSEFYEEFKSHVEKYEEKSRADGEQLTELIEAQRRNTESIAILIEETRDIIQFRRDLQGATRLGTSLQRFGLWLTKWGVIGLGLAAAYQWVAKHTVEWYK